MITGYLFMRIESELIVIEILVLMPESKQTNKHLSKSKVLLAYKCYRQPTENLKKLHIKDFFNISSTVEIEQ